MTSTPEPSRALAVATPSAIELITPKRGRGRPPGKKMRTAAEQLRHHHFSFLRSVMQGIQLRKSWEIYLAFEGGPNDERHFGARLRELLALVRLASGERGLSDMASVALSGLDELAPRPTPHPATENAPEAATAAPSPAPVAHSQPAFPNLDDWIAERCDQLGIDFDFQTQAEWLAEYRAEFNLDQPLPLLPATSLLEERPALPSPANSEMSAKAGQMRPAQQSLEARLDALNRLAGELSNPPALADALSTWLTPDLAKRLSETSVEGKRIPLLSIDNLISFINLYHYRWWAHVPRIGAERGGRILQWLVPLAEALGRPIKETSRKSLTQLTLERQAVLEKIDEPLRFGLVPLDRLAVPPELDGRHGVFRQEGVNTLGVDTDLDAIFAWMRHKTKPCTAATAGRILERFYLWSLLVKRKPMSSLDDGDFLDYRAFLEKPPADWVQERRVGRSSSEWRPFKGPQSKASIKLNFSVIAAMFKKLREQGYLRANASSSVLGTVRLRSLKINIDRSFNDSQWKWIMDCWRDEYRACGPTFEEGESQPMLPCEQSPDRSFLKAAALRRTRLILELGSTTGLRLIEFVTTRRSAVERHVVEGQSVWLMKVLGKGDKLREVVLYDDVKELLEQHHRDMQTAGTHFDPNNKKLRTLYEFETVIDDLASAGDHGALLSLPGAASPGIQGEEVSGLSADDEGRLPLIGALKKASRRKVLNNLGLLECRHRETNNADRYGSLDPSAMYQSLKRFLTLCSNRATASGALVDARGLELASTHWLRHFFANSAVADDVDITSIRDMLGHGSLTTTSVYVRSERKRIVDGMMKMKRRGQGG